jgi:uncharacterized Zn finger protein (UPF0148 family)
MKINPQSAICPQCGYLHQVKIPPNRQPSEIKTEGQTSKNSMDKTVYEKDSKSIDAEIYENSDKYIKCGLMHFKGSNPLY